MRTFSVGRQWGGLAFPEEPRGAAAIPGPALSPPYLVGFVPQPGLALQLSQRNSQLAKRKRDLQIA